MNFGISLCTWLGKYHASHCPNVIFTLRFIECACAIDRRTAAPRSMARREKINFPDGISRSVLIDYNSELVSGKVGTVWEWLLFFEWLYPRSRERGLLNVAESQRFSLPCTVHRRWLRYIQTIVLKPPGTSRKREGKMAKRKPRVAFQQSTAKKGNCVERKEWDRDWDHEEVEDALVGSLPQPLERGAVNKKKKNERKNNKTIKEFERLACICLAQEMERQFVYICYTYQWDRGHDHSWFNRKMILFQFSARKNVYEICYRGSCISFLFFLGSLQCREVLFEYPWKKYESVEICFVIRELLIVQRRISPCANVALAIALGSVPL